MKNIFGAIRSVFKPTPNDLSELQTLCVFLGPYRNLTTLTASLLSLHPNCQVLNHAGLRVFTDEKINFIENYTNEKFNAFCDFAINASKKGKRGGFGGSIVLSHAFDSPELSNAYKKRFGESLLKENIHCLIWKESQRVTNLLMKDPKGLEKILVENNKVRFLLPVRHPLDCAVSNLNTKKAALLSEENISDKISALEVIFKEYVWFLHLQGKFPDRFFCFFENKFSTEVILKLRDFLLLKSDSEWERIAVSLFHIKKNYNHDQEEHTSALQLADKYFSEFPEFKEDMHRLLKT